MLPLSKWENHDKSHSSGRELLGNHQGCVEITPGSALFLPAVPESHMTVLREDWKKFFQGRPGDAFFPLHQKSVFINIRASL